jgi:hypothetical protein
VGRQDDANSLILAKDTLHIEEPEIKDLLCHYFLSPFKSSEYFNLYHDTDINMNEVFVCVSKIFDNPNVLHEQSVILAQHLHEQSIHPKIKSGEFYTVYFKDCIVDGEMVDAVGLFKSENKDTFLKVLQAGDGFEIESEQGVNINKLDKGCLIFNTEREQGYVASVVDNTGKGAEAQYWFDAFLHVRQRRDEFYNTQQTLSLCKSFVRDELPQRFEISKADQAALLNKSVRFFKEKDNFNAEEFANEVMEDPEVIESFHRYKTDYQQTHDTEIADDFAISESALKQQARVFKSVIKLDKNFHIYVHGNRNLIEQGVEANGKKFYKIYYEEEK